MRWPSGRGATSAPAEPGISASISASSLTRLRAIAIISSSSFSILSFFSARFCASLSSSAGRRCDDLVVDLAAELDRLLAFLVADEAAHSGARLAGGDEAQPARLRVLRFGGEDFDLVAILEHRPERHDAAVDLGADRAVAKVGVDGISEVDRGRALGQLDQLALRSEGEDAILVHRHPGVLEQLLGAFGMLEDLDEVVDPGHVEVGLGLPSL